MARSEKLAAFGGMARCAKKPTFDPVAAGQNGA
jgi:hypothetical protein